MNTNPIWIRIHNTAYYSTVPPPPGGRLLPDRPHPVQPDPCASWRGGGGGAGGEGRGQAAAAGGGAAGGGTGDSV